LVVVLADSGESSHQEYAKKTYQTGSGRRELELRYNLTRNVQISMLKIGVRVVFVSWRTTE
jgi:hypothetical protein